MYYPYVLFGCGFEINAAATAAYVTAQCDICDPIKGTIQMGCDCDPLFWSTDPTPVPVTYVSPAADPAIWYSAAIPESGRFLGYRVQNVNKLNQVNRTITQRLSNAGGGVLGPLRRDITRLDFEVLLFACDELSMEYGFRYLSAKLACISLLSQECARSTLTFRNTCQTLGGSPTIDEVNAGTWFLQSALLLSGPVWGEDPISGMRKHVRKVDFTIGAEAIEAV